MAEMSEILSPDFVPPEEIEAINGDEVEEIETASQDDGITEAKKFKLDLGENLDHMGIALGDETAKKSVNKTVGSGPRPTVYDLHRKQMLEIVETQMHRITYRTMANPIDGEFTIGRVYIDNKPTTFLSCDHPKCVGTSSRYLKAFFNVSNTPHKNSFRKHHNRRHCEGGARQIFATFDDLADQNSQTTSTTPEPTVSFSSTISAGYNTEIPAYNFENEDSSSSPSPQINHKRTHEDSSTKDEEDWKKTALEWKRKYEILEGKYARTQEELHELRRLVEGFYLNALQLKQKNPSFK